jgi:predicted protein tyrosine phosphatase
MNILFVCSRNKWRSRTAETLFGNHPAHQVRSAGTEPGARIRVSEGLVSWAELIFVMEKKHRTRLREAFPSAMEGREVVVLEIPDDYEYMDAELVQMLEASVRPYLDVEG